MMRAAMGAGKNKTEKVRAKKKSWGAKAAGTHTTAIPEENDAI
jgi:hypothetical protein